MLSFTRIPSLILLPQAVRRGVRRQAYRAALAIGVATLLAGTGPVRGEEHIDVLYISSFSSQLPWSRGMLHGAMNEAQNGPGSRVRLFVEWMHADRVPPGPTPEAFLRSLDARYGDRSFDGVILDSGPAAGLLRSPHLGMLESIPVAAIAAPPAAIPADSAGHVMAVEAHGETLARIPEWLPGTERLLLIGEAGLEDRGSDLSLVREAARVALPDSVAIDMVTHGDVDRLVAELALAQPGTVAYFTPITTASTGEQIVPLELLREISATAAIPIFSAWEQMVGAGIVGGYVLSPERTGRAVIRSIRRTVAEATGAGLGDYRDAPWSPPHLWAFDARQLDRFGIDPDQLPAGSDIRFASVPIWESHPYEVSAAAVALAAFLTLTAALIAALVRNHGLLQQNKAAQKALQDANLGLEERVAARTLDLAAQAQTLARQAEALERAKAAAQAASDAKSRLLSNMSHELRTPLSAVLGFSEMLDLYADPPLSGRSREWLASIAIAGDQLQRLIEDILDLARVESGRVQLVCAACPLDAAVQESVQTVALMAEDANVEIKVDAAPCTVWADHGRLVQVITNLLTNAIKYGHDGGRIDVEGGPEGESRVALRVLDRGPGISPDKVEQIFWPFYRVNEAADEKSYGLGLALVRSLVTEMGGEVWVEPNRPRGSIFAVRLPAAGAMILRQKA